MDAGGEGVCNIGGSHRGEYRVYVSSESVGRSVVSDSL